MILYTDIKDICSMLIITLVFSYYITNTVNLARYYLRTDQQPAFQTANQYFPKAEKNSAIAINVNPEVYLNTGIRPCSRFAANQRRHFAVDPDAAYRSVPSRIDGRGIEGRFYDGAHQLLLFKEFIVG